MPKSGTVFNIHNPSVHHPFIYSFIHPFTIHPFTIHPFAIHPFTIHPFIIHPFIHSSIHPFIHSPFIHSPSFHYHRLLLRHIFPRIGRHVHGELNNPREKRNLKDERQMTGEGKLSSPGSHVHVSIESRTFCLRLVFVHSTFCRSDERGKERFFE